MASIRAKKMDGKIVSYQFTACVGRDETGKQVRRYVTWKVPEGLTPAKAKKAAEREAEEWEKEERRKYETGDVEEQEERSVTIPKRQKDDFVLFVEQVWFPYHVCDGEKKHKTIVHYKNMLPHVTDYFSGQVLQEITPLHVKKFLSFLRSDFKRRTGHEISQWYIWHHHKMLKSIFNFAVKNNYCVRNPVEQVMAPKIEKKQAEAMGKDEAALFFQKVMEPSVELELRCMLLLLGTVGLRRAELLGLTWEELDLEKGTVAVRRNAIYTPLEGTMTTSLKTASSHRTVPLIAVVTEQLRLLKEETGKKHPDVILNNVFVFHSKEDLYKPKNPDSVTRRTKRFMERNGLSDWSPHDLRHTAATMILAAGGDIKSVQNILGHADPKVTLTYYVRSDLEQMQAATDKMAKVFSL